MAGGARVGGCDLANGHCAVHHLEPGTDVELSSRAGSARVRLAPGVDVLLLRPARRAAASDKIAA